MTIVALHPDDLLDREGRGELAADELERLERHVRDCSTCRIERLSRADFRGEEDPIGPDFDVTRLLSEVLAPGADRELLRPAPAPRRAVGRRLRPLLLAAAAVLVAGAAAAAGWRGAVGRRAEAAPPAPVLEPATTFTRSTPAVQAPATLAPPAPTAAVAEPAPPERVVPAPPVVARAPAALSREPAPVAVVHTSPADRATEAAAAPALAVTRPLPVTASDAAAVFERANRARRSGDHPRAADLYRSLLDRYPDSPEAHESLAVLGRELLGDGDASGALRYFDGYLRTGGSLREDVMADRALAFGRLGRTADEAAAWGALLAAYPGSVHAARAAVRLHDLGL